VSYLQLTIEPYTAGGKRLDDQDMRASALLNLIELLPKLAELPTYIFVENVPNFEVSASNARPPNLEISW
jgi:tRNA (cytosine38-C5)-methyltransferase